MRVYGPYDRRDGRQHVVVVYDDGSRRTVSYPKYIMEAHLGRVLDPNNETVDHIDRDVTNNRIDNLRIISRKDHAALDALRVKDIEQICCDCGASFKRRASWASNNAKQGKSGPFCSRQCAGRYGAQVQNGRDKLGTAPTVPVDARQYYRNTK